MTEPAAGFTLESIMSVVPLVLRTAVRPRCTRGNWSASSVPVSPDFSVLDVTGLSSLSASTVLCPYIPLSCKEGTKAHCNLEDICDYL